MQAIFIIFQKKFMETLVIPFVPQVTDANPAAAAAKQLQELINNTTAKGWEFMELGSMNTTVNPTGCAKLGGGKAELVSIQLLIFRK